MSVDVLQGKIRKQKYAVMVDLSVLPQNLPEHLLQNGQDLFSAYKAFCLELMNTLKGTVPALRFRYGMFAMLGSFGTILLEELLKEAAARGFYVMVDAPQMDSAEMAAFTAERFWGKDSCLPCDALNISAFPGSDILKPFLPYCKDDKKDLFVTVRTPNKSASELQDVQTGARQLHIAAVDYVSRSGANQVGRAGFSRIGVVAAAAVPNSLKQIREKYGRLFVVVDGIEYPGASIKGCTNAFDKLGHGAIVCAGAEVCCAWKQEGLESTAFAEAALGAVGKVQKNISRYVAIL